MTQTKRKDDPYRLTKLACYATNMSMSVVSALSPLLFLTFRTLYGISYTFLGFLVLVNFSTQLCVDLLLSLKAEKWDMRKLVRFTPAITCAGWGIYALFPFFLPHQVPLCLLLGTIVFSASAGLSEVLISPVIMAIPAEHPEREMSKLHSVFAWGTVVVVTMSTLFLKLFAKERWQFLAIFWMVIPLFACFCFFRAPIPELSENGTTAKVSNLFTNKRFLLCFFCIFLGGASECIMEQWSSSYLEGALAIPKVWGDLLGVALFALMLGMGRSLYAKFGGNVEKVLALGSLATTVCYLVASLTTIPLLGLAACALSGLSTAMLWPGSLLASSTRFPDAGVTLFALMAAGGDLGGALGPQLLGAITDGVMRNTTLLDLATTLHLSADQMGMKVGLLCATVFPLLATILFLRLWKRKKE